MMPRGNKRLSSVQRVITSQAMQLEEIKIAKFNQKKFRILFKSPKETVMGNFMNKNILLSVF